MSVIIKVQRPVISSDREQPWLLYDEDRSHSVMISGDKVPKAWIKLMGSDYKMYCQAEWFSIPEGHWEIYRKVARQEW